MDKDFLRQISGYGLTTAQIHYRMPDQPSLLQLFIWQHNDLAPDFPHLKRFLSFWEREIEGPLHSVQIAHRALIRPTEWRALDGVISVH